MAQAIYLEGMDGSGKSTQLKLLKNYLENKNKKVLTLREPGGSDYYEALRDFYIKSPHAHPPISDALISAAGRAANIAEATDALKSGKWIISDRSYLSSYVYQSVQGVPLKSIQNINAYALQGFEYDFKIVLDTPTDIAMQRINDLGLKKDYWESLGSEFFEKIRQTYLKIAKTENCIIIDSSVSIERVHEEIIKSIKNDKY